MSNFEVMSFKDKTSRDATFGDLRRTGNRSEREVVKFSGCELVMSEHGNGELELDSRFRVRYSSIFYLAYPRREDERKTRRREMKDRQCESKS